MSSAIFLSYNKEQIEVITFFVRIVSVIVSICGAAAFLTSAIIAWRTYSRFYRNSIEKEWFVAFNSLYKEFWDSNDASMIRECIFIDSTYEPIDLILRKVVNKTSVTISAEEYKVIDTIDRFCAILFRILILTDLKVAKHHKTRYMSVIKFWLVAIKRRDFLYDYIKYDWAPLYEKMKNIEESSE